MGGPGSGGHNRKPAAILKLQGAYSERKHGNRGVPTIGTPVKPSDLPPAESQMWDRIVEALPDGTLGAADSMCLEGLVRWYRVWRLSIVDATDSRAIRRASSAWSHVAALAARFGLTPTDRQRLPQPAPPRPDRDPMEDLLG